MKVFLVKFHLVLATFLFLFLNSVYSQTGRLFSVDNELSSSMIFQVFQDHYGIIWIATEDGLNRYDGSKFIKYRKDVDNKFSLLNNYVRTLFEDSKNNLYIGFFNGLQRYDYATDSFVEIPMILETGEKYEVHVTSIVERKNGDIIVGSTGHGLFKLDYNGGSVVARQTSGLVPTFLISCLYEDRNENLWISSQDKGLFCLDKQNRLKNYFSAKDIPGNSISSICEDKEGVLYVGSVISGLNRYDSISDSFSSVAASSALIVQALCLSSNGDIYLGTERNGLKVYNPAKNNITEGAFNISTIDFSKSKVHSIMEDKSGNIWLGIFQKGVVLLPMNKSNFEYIGYKSIKNNIIGSSSIISVCKDNKGILWVGTDGEGIYGIDSKGSQKVHFGPGKGKENVAPTIFSIYEDSNRDLWVGSYSNGVGVLDRQTGRVKYINNILEKNSAKTLRVFDIVEDSHKNLWIATMGMGLYCLNLKSRKVVHYDAVIGTLYRDDSNILHNGWITSLAIAANEKLYIGTVDGLGCLDLKTRSFLSTYGVKRLLQGKIIYSLYADRKGTIWIGTSEGLKYIKSNSTEISAYTVKDGLPSNVICSIKEDSLNNLWISTNYGISKFDQSTETFINYYANDGLQGNEFNKGAGYADNQTGKIIFGGINGITIFNPNEIKDEVKELRVHFTGFYIHDQPVKKGMKSGSYAIVSSPAMDADTYNLSYKDNSFTVEFSTMEYNNPERITYMYSLGENNNWISLRAGTNEVTFNNLAPGKYNFSVKAKDYNTFSNIKTISIIIHPAWYLSAWAKFAYFLALSTIVLLVVQEIRQRNKTKRKMLEHIHAKQINEAKLQFFINIAHEIRTPISLIISPLKKLIIKDKDKDRQVSYSTMNRNSNRILSLINQLMDIQKIDKGQMQLMFQETEIVQYVHELCQIFEEHANAKEIEIRFHHDNEKNVWIDPNNFDKVILNVLSNAVKFTPKKGKIDVYMATGKDDKAESAPADYFQIIISDSGIGIPDDKKHSVFDCFFQVRDTKCDNSEGTGIGLHLARSIVELHHGRIWVENNINECGCRFMIRLPLGNSHLKPDEIEQRKTSKEMLKPELPPVSLETPEPESRIKSKSKNRVLVIDDDAEIRRYLCKELASDYHVADCGNGKNGLSMILEKAPDLIISDIMMPDMDGITLCRKIKHNVNINHIPVILLTAKTKEEDNLEGLNIGADAYIVKPFNIEILKKTIQNILKNREILRNNYTGSQHQKDKIRNVIMSSPDEKLLKKVTEVINKNISNPSLNVEMLTREIGISRVHLHRKLKELTSQSTRDFVRNIRLQQAAKLLSDKPLNISEVAYAVGFTNIAHFSVAFKEFYGMSPSQYMENHLNDKENR